MTRFPSVAVVVLNHDYGQYVGEALASAVAQRPGKYRLVEVVVIDDGSTDCSARVYERFPDVRVVQKHHEGFAATLTRAVVETSADWIAPLDADDAFTSGKLATLARHLADPRRLLLQHAEFVVDAHGHPFAEGRHSGGSTSTLVVRTEAARDLLPITNELFLHVLADLGHGLRLDSALTRYRVHDEAMTDRHTPGVFADYMAGVCDRVAARLDDLSTRPPRWAGTEQLTELAAAYRSRATAHEVEAGRQRESGSVASTDRRRSA